ncbi:MAG: apolipoprotein N-acyltransferase [Pseudomonadota bacterium]|nr:apolipoprotein N-acyltransferase [Pseudomonadota bacterium]
MAASRVDVAARLRGLHGWGRWLALPLGGLLALAFAPLSHYLLAYACTAALFVLWHGASPREAAWRGFLFTVGTFLAGR